MGQVQATTDTEVTLQNIQELYRKFTDECPSGNLHLHEFKKIFGVSSKSPEEEDGKLDFMEYVAAVNLVLRGKLIDKLKWSFKIYDNDGNGCLTNQEVRSVIKIITKIKWHNDSNAETVDFICDRIFELTDKNKDSQISLEEFIEGAEKDPWLMEQLRLDLAPKNWFIKNQEKKN
ncbi:guanylyl cyclase-activating protein 2-like isoform X2 [Poeciliopsis prolifica]|uniref:guanylyl cyclase-activating protein 2-like isoform X2 n=1 Tax=Poeciliopsis prolifica TaxID=188132 RepID=UPI00241450F4|nr:guanylyl cyclase-activating protein 2-like isoform X2 [Poeciliopsis prolifica]